MSVMTHFLLWSLGFVKAEALITDAERQCLARHAAGKKHLVESGVWHGVTTSMLRSVMALDGVLLAIDPYPIGRLGFSAQLIIAHKEVAKIPSGSVRWIRSTGVQAACDYAASGGESVDFVFIDGDHSYEGLRGDWEGWSQLVAPGGIVALHDSCSSAVRQIDDAGSVIFTREVVLRDPRFKLIEIVDTLSVLHRHSSAWADRQPNTITL